MGKVVAVILVLAAIAVAAGVATIMLTGSRGTNLGMVKKIQEMRQERAGPAGEEAVGSEAEDLAAELEELDTELTDLEAEFNQLEMEEKAL